MSAPEGLPYAAPIPPLPAWARTCRLVGNALIPASFIFGMVNVNRPLTYGWIGFGILLATAALLRTIGDIARFRHRRRHHL